MNDTDILNTGIEGKTAIYALVDPRQPEIIRYIGKTKVPRIRHLQHCSEIWITTKGKWVESLRQIGILPQMKILEWVTNTDANNAEKRHICSNQTEYLTNTHNITLDITEGLTQTELSEKEQILQALDRCGWNKLKTAQFLGIGRQTLYNKIKLYELLRIT